MTDIQYVYQNDIREKKNAGRGAFHKKCGAKSKKCTFPSDYMTRKEKMAMSGECKTYDMRKFYTYEEFKQFPDDIQLQYLNSLINRYDVTIAAIADELFHITPTGLYKYLRKHELLQYINKAPNGKSAMALQGRARLMSAIEKANNPVEETIPEPEVETSSIKVVGSESINDEEYTIRFKIDGSVEAPPIEDPEPALEEPFEPKVFANFRSMRIEMDDWDSDILDFLRTRFAGGDYHITITVDKDS